MAALLAPVISYPALVNSSKNGPDEIINRLLLELEKSGEGTERVDILKKLGDAYVRSKPVKALNFAQQGIKLSESINYQKSLADCLYLPGKSYYYQGNYDQALMYASKGLKIKEELGDKKGVSDTYKNTGIIYYNKDNYSKALEYYFKSLRIREEIGDKSGIAERMF